MPTRLADDSRTEGEPGQKRNAAGAVSQLKQAALRYRWDVQPAALRSVARPAHVCLPQQAIPSRLHNSLCLSRRSDQHQLKSILRPASLQASSAWSLALVQYGEHGGKLMRTIIVRKYESGVLEPSVVDMVFLDGVPA